jgi:hypothetical protein
MYIQRSSEGEEEKVWASRLLPGMRGRCNVHAITILLSGDRERLARVKVSHKIISKHSDYPVSTLNAVVGECSSSTGKQCTVADPGPGMHAWQNAAMDQKITDAARENDVASGLTDMNQWTVLSAHYGWWDRNLTPGEFGCARSHLAAWQWGVRQDIDWLWVMEDDVVLTEDIVANFRTMLSSSKVLKKKPDIIHLGRCDSNPLGRVDNFRDQEPIVAKFPTFSVRVARGTSWTGCLVLSMGGLRKLTDAKFDQCLFNVDDYLNAVNNTHYRMPEMQGLPCVASVRRAGWVALVCDPSIIDPDFDLPSTVFVPDDN